MITRFLPWLFSFFRPRSVPVIVPAPAPVPRNPHNWRASRIARKNAQLIVVMAIGRGYERIPVAAPAGYFWKQDLGALHGVGSRRWRLYREPVRCI